MIREQKTRNNFNPIYLKRAWKDFDRVAVVRESLKPTCIEFFPKVESKLVTVHNTIDLDAYSLKSGEPLEEQIEDKVAIDDLVDTNLIKIITIGRLSPEKGHLRLITAFEKAAIDNEALRLYIVGGHGKSEELLVNRIEDSIVKDKIHLVTTVSNPYPLLKFSDGFILSSFYEGLPMVFSEAVMAGVPIVSVSIDGPTEFLNQGFGKVVSNSVTGIYDGITMLANKEVKPASLVKLSEFNSNALTEFDDILK
ncbi:glycosyltransferase [Vibrio ishigakensis]|uniref:Glycosyltransferase n=1 Tax=Vibrio ishigakensis TaxID=1481914 RepID=A0A0B8PA72_9VIBR|nr:glycosyltransferase [Vibrio ishigakensis]